MYRACLSPRLLLGSYDAYLILSEHSAACCAILHGCKAECMLRPPTEPRCWETPQSNVNIETSTEANNQIACSWLNLMLVQARGG